MDKFPVLEVEAPCPTSSCPERMRRLEDIRGRKLVWQHGENPEAVFLASQLDLVEWGEVELRLHIGAWLQQIHARRNA